MYYERFLNNFTANATEEEQTYLEDIFQRFAGGNVAYYGRQGVCTERYTLAEKLDTLFEETDKRRKQYIDTLPLQRRNAVQRAHESTTDWADNNLTSEDLKKMMTAWELDYKSWMHEKHWKGFHKVTQINK